MEIEMDMSTMTIEQLTITSEQPVLGHNMMTGDYYYDRAVDADGELYEIRYTPVDGFELIEDGMDCADWEHPTIVRV